MKALKWIGIILLILIAVFLIFSATQADHIELEESVIIDAPVEQVYAEISDFNNWADWSTWNQMDTNMRSEFSEEMGVVGAWNQWWSENPQVGNGRQEVVEIRENEYMKVALTFEGMEDAVHAEMILEPVEEGTKLRWTFIGADMPFYMGWMNALIKPALEMNYQQSLKMLKEQMESMPAEAPMPEQLEIVTLEAQPIISILDSTNPEGISALLGQLYTELGIYASSTEGVEITGMPLAIWHQYSEDKAVFEAAMPISGSGENKGRVMVKELMAGDSAEVETHIFYPVVKK